MTHADQCNNDAKADAANQHAQSGASRQTLDALGFNHSHTVQQQCKHSQSKQWKADETQQAKLDGANDKAGPEDYRKQPYTGAVGYRQHHHLQLIELL